MKNILLFFVMFLSTFQSVSAQNNGGVKELTKFETFSSKTGSIVKFVDVKMPNMSKSFMGSLETGIRTIIRQPESAYFYRIEEPETQRSISHIAMIEYSDLVEINKAITRLTAEVDNDCQSNPDYLENKFRTEDGFEVGYYVSKGKASWFLKLERYSSSTVFIKNKEELVTAFSNAQHKIEELKDK